MQPGRPASAGRPDASPPAGDQQVETRSDALDLLPYLYEFGIAAEPRRPADAIVDAGRWLIIQMSPMGSPGPSKVKGRFTSEGLMSEPAEWGSGDRWPGPVGRTGLRVMLQIVTKMYFREGVPLHETVHRDVLYTNCGFLHRAAIELPIGTLVPSTPASPVSTVTVSVTEHLEPLEFDGSDAMRISIGGLELVDDLGVVLSFGLNGIFSRNRDLVRRLVPDALGNDRGTQATRLFGRTFEAHRYVPPAELEQLRRFMEQLLALRRDHYEAAMRAIRRIVGNATCRGRSDAGLYRHRGRTRVPER